MKTSILAYSELEWVFVAMSRIVARGLIRTVFKPKKFYICSVRYKHDAANVRANVRPFWHRGVWFPLTIAYFPVMEAFIQLGALD